jgi:two-component system, OmpR family, response regulator
MKCVVIEDDPQTLRYICQALEDALHTATRCDNGLDALHHIVHEDWDLVVLDRLLPGAIDGLSIVRKLREMGKSVPVLVVSALAATDERVRGLREGADDYLSKPFAISELMARIEALHRRQHAKYHSPLLQVADLTLDTRSFRVTRGTTPIALQPREFRLLTYLMRHAGQVVTRMMVLEAIWGCNFLAHSEVVEVQISRLRKKVDKGFSPALIHTVRGVGYWLGTPVSGLGERVAP